MVDITEALISSFSGWGGTVIGSWVICSFVGIGLPRVGIIEGEVPRLHFELSGSVFVSVELLKLEWLAVELEEKEKRSMGGTFID